MRVRWARLGMAAAGAVVVVSSACGVASQPHAELLGDGKVPFSLLDPEAPPLVPTTVADENEPVTLCFVREGRLALVEQPLDSPVNLIDSVRALASPPGGGGLRTALSDRTVVAEVRVVGGIARVDLGPSISNLTSTDQLLAVAQVVCTLTGRPGVGQVAFTLQGSPIDVPRGDGSLVPDRVSRDDYANLIS
ncbi:MAG: GerMN domain-containing protein [Acidimicrobiales bacterium]